MHQTGFLQQILIAVTVSQSTLPSLNLDLTLEFSQTIAITVSQSTLPSPKLDLTFEFSQTI